MALESGLTNVVVRLMDDCRMPLKDAHEETTPLMVAVLACKHDLVIELMRRGASITDRSQDGDCILTAALESGDVGMVRWATEQPNFLEMCQNFDGKRTTVFDYMAMLDAVVSNDDNLRRPWLENVRTLIKEAYVAAEKRVLYNNENCALRSTKLLNSRL